MKKEPIVIHNESIALSGMLFRPDQDGLFPLVIFSHGAFEFKENFFDFCEYLAGRGFCAAVIDMPGHGESGGDRFRIDIALWQQALFMTIDTLTSHSIVDGERVGLFGFSSGGTAVLEAALIDPRVKAVVTLDATVRNYMGIWETLMLRVLSGLGHIKKRITGTDLHLCLTYLLKTATVANDPDVNQTITSDPRIRAAYKALPIPGAIPCAIVDTINRMDRIKVPTLVLHGDKDRIDPVGTAYLLYERLQCEKSIEILMESGHFGHLDTQKHTVMQLTGDWMLNHL